MGRDVIHSRDLSLTSPPLVALITLVAFAHTPLPHLLHLYALCSASPSPSPPATHGTDQAQPDDASTSYDPSGLGGTSNTSPNVSRSSTGSRSSVAIAHPLAFLHEGAPEPPHANLTNLSTSMTELAVKGTLLAQGMTLKVPYPT